MTNSDEEKNGAERVKQDLKLSVLTGPLTFIVPVLSYLFLYPIILSRSSIEVLGIWSLYVTTASFFTIADVGFSQHFMREAGVDCKGEILSKLRKEFHSAKLFYLVIGLFGLIIIFLIKDILFASAENIYSPANMFYSAIILLIGTTLQLLSSLEAAILSARADNYFVKLLKSVSPLFTYGIAIIGALISSPIEGFAVGFLMANLFLLIVYSLRIRIKHNEWKQIKVGLTLRETLAQLKGLFTKGWMLYSVSLGMILRQPILRYVVAFVLGLPAAGVLDIAMRLTATLRDFITSGFASLYPSFSYFYRNNKKENLIEILKISLMLLIPVGAVSLIILIFFNEFIYQVWLSDFPAGIISATIILAVWQFITIINVPFWYLLQASRLEKIAAISIWAHTILIFLMVPFTFSGFDVTLNQLLIYWTATALLTQFLIYYYTETKLAMLWIVVKDNRFKVIFLNSLLFIGINILVGVIFSFKVGDILYSAIIITVLFIASLSPYYITILKKSLELRKT